jgi:hypothetical protein
MTERGCEIRSLKLRAALLGSDVSAEREAAADHTDKPLSSRPSFA